MTLGASRGVKTNLWFANELFENEDANFISQAFYMNLTDIASLLGSQTHEDGIGNVDRVVSGLEIEWDNLLTSDIHAGLAVSWAGRYFTTDVWGFTSSLGESFSVYVPVDVAVAVDPGGAQDRYDTIEIRPIETDYDPQSKQFKDPVTGVVSAVIADTKTEYGYEMQVKKGTEGGSPVAPTKTQGWIKLAEIHVVASATAITQNDIYDVRRAELWTTETSETLYPHVNTHDLLAQGDVTVEGTIIADTINEYTAAAGVTIDGTLIKDDAITNPGGNLTIESVIFNGQAISNVTSIDATSIANSGGDLTVESLTISGAVISNGAGNVTIESVVFNGQAISNLTAIGTTNLTASVSINTPAIANSGGNLSVEGVTFNGSAITTVSTLDMTSSLTVDTINEHTGSAGVTIESVLLEANSVTATNLNGLVGTATQGTINHDSLANYAANRHRQIFVQTGAPSSPVAGDIWIDTT